MLKKPLKIVSLSRALLVTSILLIVQVNTPLNLSADISIDGMSFTVIREEYDIEAWQVPDILITDAEWAPELRLTSPLSDIPGLSSSSPAKRLTSPLLFYPNPFRKSQHGFTELGYYLSDPMDIEIRIYNIQAQEIFRKLYPEGSNGGKEDDDGYNRVVFSQSDFPDYDLHSGVYLVVLIHDGVVIGRTKLAVLP